MVKWLMEEQFLIHHMDAIVNTVVKIIFLLSVIVAGRIIVIDWEIDAPGHSKSVVDDRNEIDKVYFGKCLCLTSTTELHTDYKKINIHYMNEEGEFSFAEEWQCFRVHQYSIGMTGYTKHKKREASSTVNRRL